MSSLRDKLRTRIPEFRAKVIALSTLALVAGAGCSHENWHSSVAIAQIGGQVHGGQQPVSGSSIQLWAMGSSGDGSPSTALLRSAVTSSDGSGNKNNSNANAGNGFNSLPVGSFVITGDYNCPSSATPVYLTAVGGNPGEQPNTNNQAIALLAVLGQCGNLTANTYVSVNELTTVGSLAAMASYTSSYSSMGFSPTDANFFQNALAQVNEFVNISSGTAPGSASPSGYYTYTNEINTVADILAGCVNSAGGIAGDGSYCGTLFELTTPVGGQPPTDTVGAMLNIAANNLPFDSSAIFDLLQPDPPFQPTLSVPIPFWYPQIIPVSLTTPIITPASGSYTEAEVVSISETTPGATIYYTTDGSNPTTSSSVYSVPFVAYASETIKAIAVITGVPQTAIATSTLTIASPALTSIWSGSGSAITGENGYQSWTASLTQAGYNITGTITITGDPAFSPIPFQVSGTVGVNGLLVFTGTQNGETLSYSGTIEGDYSYATGPFAISGPIAEQGMATLNDSNAGIQFFGGINGPVIVNIYNLGYNVGFVEVNNNLFGCAAAPYDDGIYPQPSTFCGTYYAPSGVGGLAFKITSEFADPSDAIGLQGLCPTAGSMLPLYGAGCTIPLYYVSPSGLVEDLYFSFGNVGTPTNPILP